MAVVDVQNLVDEARFGRLHRSVLIWGFVILVLDGYDLAVVGAALPSIMKSMNVEATTAGFMASSAVFGMMFGAMLLGTLADRIGRRMAIAICVFLFSVFTAAAGLTSDPISFSAMRFLAGLGIGGAIPNVAAQMSEYAPKRMRGILVTLSCCGYAVGSILAALLGKQLLGTYGWQSVFIAAGLPVLLIPFIFRYMPESIAFLSRRGDDGAVRQLVAALRPDFSPSPDDELRITASARAGGGVGALFNEGRGFSTVMLWLAGIAGLFMLYALSSWLVKLMDLAGYSLGSALTFLFAYNVGGIVGALGGGWLGDRFNIKWVTFAFFVVAAISLTLLGYGTEPLILIVALVGASTLGTQILLYAYTAQFYPTSIRSTGLGFATGVGRIGAISAPIIIGFLVALDLPLAQNFLAIGLAAGLGAIAIGLIDQRQSAVTSASLMQDRGGA